MEEKNIIITIENYNGQNIRFIASANARVQIITSSEGSKITDFDIDVRDDNILIEKEDLINELYR